MTGLPQNVVEQDHRLEASHERSMEALAKLRWHWTLDESNPGRVAMREYARQVGRALMQVQRYANGYVIWRTDTPRGVSLTDAMEQARVGAETYAATKAVAEAHNVATSTARQKRPAEVKRVRQIAQERAERRGTTVEEEAPKVAKVVARVQQHSEERAQVRRASPLRYIALEQALAKAARNLGDALMLAGECEWNESEREIIGLAIESVRRVLQSVDRRMAGATGIDFEKEVNTILAGMGD